MEKEREERGIPGGSPSAPSVPTKAERDALGRKLFYAFCKGKPYGHSKEHRRLREIWFYTYMGKADCGWTKERMIGDLAYDFETTKHWPEVYGHSDFKQRLEVQRTVLLELLRIVTDSDNTALDAGRHKDNCSGTCSDSVDLVAAKDDSSLAATPH